MREDQIISSISGLSQQQAVFQNQIETVKKDVEKILKILVDGNGHSLVTQVSLLNSDMEEMEKRIEKINTRAASFGLALCSAVLALVGNLVLFFLKFFTKVPT